VASVILPLRRKYGFEVVGAWTARDEDTFVWIIGHAEFEAANERYYASPERVSLDPDPTRHLAESDAKMMDPI
jgi:hypothetical protein